MTAAPRRSLRLRRRAPDASPTSTARSASTRTRSGCACSGARTASRRSAPAREDLLVLHEEPGARPGGRAAGLFHFALLYPSREELARALQRLAATRTPLDGASDHGVSEALYLHDPDNHGIELYADRPRAAWPPPAAPGERVGMYTRALDLDDLLATIAGEAPVAARRRRAAHGPRAPARRGPRRGARVLRRPARARADDDLPGRAVPRRRRLPPSPRREHLGRRGRRAGAAGHGAAAASGRCCFDDAAELDAVRERMGGEVAEDPWGIRLRFEAAPVK